MSGGRLLALSWVLLAVVVASALALGSVGSEPPTPAERVRSLSGQFACPQCDGQSVRDSDAGISAEIRAEISRRVQAGQSDGEVLSALVAAYGRENLLTPSASGAASLVWAIPVVVAVLAVAGLVVGFARWRPGGARASEEDRALVERARREHSDGAAEDS